MERAAEQLSSVSATYDSYLDDASYPGKAREPRDLLGACVAQLGIIVDTLFEHALALNVPPGKAESTPARRRSKLLCLQRATGGRGRSHSVSVHKPDVASHRPGVPTQWVSQRPARQSANTTLSLTRHGLRQCV